MCTFNYQNNQILTSVMFKDVKNGSTLVKNEIYSKKCTFPQSVCQPAHCTSLPSFFNKNGP